MTSENGRKRLNGALSFPKSISPKVNVIARLGFELAYFEDIVWHFSHYTTQTSSEERIIIIIIIIIN